MKGLQFLVGFAALVIGVVQSNETCTRTKLITARHFFNTDKMLGSWYTQEMYAGLKDDVNPLPFKCLEINYFRNDSTKSELGAEEKYFDFNTGQNEVMISNVVIDDKDEEAIWIFNVELPGGHISVADNVWLQTDYDNWAIHFFCHVVENRTYENLSIMSRSRIMDPKTLEILRHLAHGYGFPAENAMPVTQIGCPAKNSPVEL